jgi:hypothetical protein
MAVGHLNEPDMARAICSKTSTYEISICPHPSYPALACSPDALDLMNNEAYEFKTRVMSHDPFPALPEYLQVQFSLMCCAQVPIYRWYIATELWAMPNRPRFSWMILPDKDLHDLTLLPRALEFCAAVDRGIAMMHEAGLSAEEAYEQVKFPRFTGNEKAVLHQLVAKSIQSHMFPHNPSSVTLINNV